MAMVFHLHMDTWVPNLIAAYALSWNVFHQWLEEYKSRSQSYQLLDWLRLSQSQLKLLDPISLTDVVIPLTRSRSRCQCRNLTISWSSRSTRRKLCSWWFYGPLPLPMLPNGSLPRASTADPSLYRRLSHINRICLGRSIDLYNNQVKFT